MQVEIKVEFIEQQKAVVANTQLKAVVEFDSEASLDENIKLIEEKAKALFNRAYEFSQEKTFSKPQK